MGALQRGYGSSSVAQDHYSQYSAQRKDGLTHPVNACRFHESSARFRSSSRCLSEKVPRKPRDTCSGTLYGCCSTCSERTDHLNKAGRNVVLAGDYEIGIIIRARLMGLSMLYGSCITGYPDRPPQANLMLMPILVLILMLMLMLMLIPMLRLSLVVSIRFEGQAQSFNPTLTRNSWSSLISSKGFERSQPVANPVEGVGAWYPRILSTTERTMVGKNAFSRESFP